jgi:hypothetical protein
VPITYAGSAHKHQVPHDSIWYVLMTVESVPHETDWGEAGLWYVGPDNRGITLEIGTVRRGRNEMVYHAMPLSDRHNHEPKETK